MLNIFSAASEISIIYCFYERDLVKNLLFI